MLIYDDVLLSLLNVLHISLMKQPLRIQTSDDGYLHSLVSLSVAEYAR